MSTYVDICRYIYLSRYVRIYLSIYIYVNLYMIASRSINPCIPYQLTTRSHRPTPQLEIQVHMEKRPGVVVTGCFNNAGQLLFHLRVVHHTIFIQTTLACDINLSVLFLWTCVACLASSEVGRYWAAFPYCCPVLHLSLSTTVEEDGGADSVSVTAALSISPPSSVSLLLLLLPSLPTLSSPAPLAPPSTAALPPPPYLRRRHRRSHLPLLRRAAV